MDNAVEELHEASLHILQYTGVVFHHPEIIQVLQKNGIKVVGQTALFSPAEIMGWIKKAPSSFKVYARNPQYNIELGGEATEFAAGYGAPSVIDQGGIKRKALLADYINFLKLVQQSSFFNINGGILVQPNDVSTPHQFLMMMYASLLYSDKCLMSGAGGRAETEAAFDLLDIVFDKESLVEKPRVLAILNSTSPLQYDKDTLDTLLLFVQYRQPVIITPGVMAGTTGPVTLAGTIALSNAEILAGIAISQMLREGTPVVYGMQSTAADMRTGAIANGSPERSLCLAYGSRLAKHYELPCRGGGSENDAHSLSVQSGYEGMMDMMVACQEKVNLIIHSAGMLDSHLAMSYEKFIVDLEIIGMVRRFLKGIDTCEESLATGLIDSVGPGGEYLTCEHTLKHFRNELYLPFVSLRGALPVGVNPQKALMDNISKKKEELLFGYAPPRLPQEAVCRLKEYLRVRGADEALVKAVEQ